MFRFLLRRLALTIPTFIALMFVTFVAIRLVPGDPVEVQAVRAAAFEANLSNSDQVRVLLGLPLLRQAKRPRLTVSLSEEDYRLLGARYALDPADHLAIKERVGAALVAFADKQRKQRTGKRRDKT